VRVFQLCFARAAADARAPLLADFVATLRHQFGLMPVRLLPDQIGSSATPSLAALGHGSGSVSDLGLAGLKSPTSAAAAQEAASVRLVSVAHLPAFGISPEAASHEALGTCPPLWAIYAKLELSVSHMHYAIRTRTYIACTCVCARSVSTISFSPYHSQHDLISFLIAQWRPSRCSAPRATVAWPISPAAC
jgi:hypothetical protein